MWQLEFTRARLVQINSNGSQPSSEESYDPKNDSITDRDDFVWSGDDVDTSSSGPTNIMVEYEGKMDEELMKMGETRMDEREVMRWR